MRNEIVEEGFELLHKIVDDSNYSEIAKLATHDFIKLIEKKVNDPRLHNS